MRRISSLCAAFALGAVMLSAPAAKAVTVSFVTVGTFDSGDLANSNEYLDALHGIDIVFNSSVGNSVDVPPASLATFGTFDTSGTLVTTTSFVPVSSGFKLDIFQTGPLPGALSFAGSLAGTLKYSNSQAYVQFTTLTGNIVNPGLIVSYTITSQDGGTPGRVALSPPTVNGGISTISGLVDAVVPEPSSIALFGLGAPLLLLYRARRNRVAA